MHLSARKVVSYFFVFLALMFFSVRPAQAQALPDAIGNAIVFESNDRLDMMNLDGSDVIDFAPGQVSAYSPDFSKDGRYIYFVSNRDGNPEIYVMDAYGSNQTRLTNDPATDTHPTISPDGQKVAFESIRDGSWEIYVMNSDGSNVQRLTNNSFDDRDPSWSPDGQKIIFYSQSSLGGDIHRIDSDGSNETQITATTQEEFNPRYSPDGQYIVFWGEPDGVSRPDIFRINADGSNQVNLTNNTTIWDSNPVWSPDGTTIAFESQESSNSGLATFLINPDGTNRRALGRLGQQQETPSWARMGNHAPVMTSPPAQDSFVLIGGQTTLTRTATDLEGGPLTYYWDLDNNGSFETEGQSVQYSGVGKTKGDYDIRVKAVDNVGLRVRQGWSVHVDDGVTIDDFVLFALDSMWLKKSVSVSGGNVGVQNTNASSLLAHDAELTLGAKVTIPDLSGGDQESNDFWWRGDQIYADSIWAGNKTYLPTLHYNELTASPSAYIWRKNAPSNTPPTYPVVANMPTFPTFTVGTQDVVVATSSAQTLAPGSYRNLDVMTDGELRLTGGVYNFKSWDQRANSRVYFTAPTEVRISGRLKTGDSAIVRNDPTVTTTWAASKVFVKGKNGDTGDMTDSPKSVTLGAHTIFNGNIYAPNGSIFFLDYGIANGGFIGKWIIANPFSQFGWDNTFSP